MKNSFENNILTVSPEGRIDSNNAADVEKEIFEILGNNETDNVVIDLEKLDYISSAGLRVMLKIRKAKPMMKIINVQPSVYEVFETTGFTEMMNIEKGYRQLNVEGCEKLGEGSNGVVYRLNPEIIVKIYKKHNTLADIERERTLARTAFIKGIPTAIAFDIVKVDGKLGSVFELLNATSISKLLAEDSSDENIDKYAQIFVDLLHTIHDSTDDANIMTDHREVGIGWIDYLKDYLPEDKWTKLKAMMEAIPEDDHILHGDFHTNNVLMQNDEPILIDMDTLSHGKPIFEFASIYNAYLGFSALNHDNIKDFLKIDYETGEKFYWKTLEKYFGTTDEAKLMDVHQKSMLMGYVRLLRRQIKRGGFEDPESVKKIEFYKSQVLDLLDKVDDFEI